jgi:hypothetical protein
MMEATHKTLNYLTFAPLTNMTRTKSCYLPSSRSLQFFSEQGTNTNYLLQRHLYESRTRIFTLFRISQPDFCSNLIVRRFVVLSNEQSSRTQVRYGLNIENYYSLIGHSDTSANIGKMLADRTMTDCAKCRPMASVGSVDRRSTEDAWTE